MFDEQDRQYFYNEFKNNGYEVGSYDDFKKDLNNKEDRDWYYNEAKNMGYDVGTLEDFDKMVLEPAPSTSGGAQQVAASTQSVGQNASTETKPQVAQPAAKPAAEKPKEDNRSWFTKWMTGSLPEEEKPETADKEPGLIAKALGMIPTGVQTSNGTYQPSPAISQPVVKGEEKPVKEEASPSSSANAASPESKEAAPVTTPTSVVNNEGLMDAKLANYLENWKQRPDKEGDYFENMVADLLADGTANSNEEAVKMVQSALGRYANRSAMDVTNQVVSSLPDDTVQDAEKSIETQWYSHGVQDKLKQEADNMGISYDDYVGLFLKPAMVQSLVNKYGPNYRNIAEGIATRLYAHDEHVQDRLMNQDINDALSSVIKKYVNPSVVDEYNKAQEAGSKAFAEGMEGSQYIPANLRLGTALGAQYEANEAKDPAKVLSGLQKKFGRLYRNPEFLNDMSNAAFKVMQRYGLNGGMSGDPKQFKPMINSVLKNELDQLEIKGMMPKGSAEYIMKTGLGNTIVGKITRKAVQTDYQNWLEDIANQQYQPGFWENVASGALTFAGDAWSYWLPGAAGGKLIKSMLAKAEGRLAGDLMAKGMESRMAARAAKLLIGKSKTEALKSGAVHGAVTFGGQSAISKPIDEKYRTGQFDENGKIYNPSGWKIALDTLLEGGKQGALGVIMQGNTIANMIGKGRGLATNILADIGGKVADSGIMTGHQMLERMAQDPNFKPTGKDAAESFLESMANLTAIGLPGMVGKYARFKDAREFNTKYDFTDQDIAELKRFGYEDLRDAFEKVGIGEYAVEGENAQRLDGQLTQKYMNLMNDKSVPEVLKAKMMAVVEGKRPSSFSPVVDSVIVQPMDNGGKVYLETLNKDGGIIERKEYSSLDDAQKADKKLEYEKTLGLASVLEGEFHNEFTQEHLDGLYNQAAQKYNMGEKLTDEDKAAVYLHQNAGAIKDIMDKQQKGIILTEEEQKQVDTYRYFYNSALENSSVMREFVNTFEDSHGVARGTLRKALESKDKKYAPLVESYLKELYNSIELKREMKQTVDDLYNTAHGNEQKRIEQSGQEPPVSEEPAPYQDRTNSVPSPSDANSAANVANSAVEVATSDAFVMGQEAYKNGDSGTLKAIDYNSDLATGRLKRAFADSDTMFDLVTKAYNEGRDMEQFVAQRAGNLTPVQKEAIGKYVEAMDAKKGTIDALQHADDGYGEALKEQLWPYQTEDGNIVPATLTSGKQVFLKKANEYGGGFVVVPDEQGQPTIKQVSNAEIKEVGTPVSLDEYIESSLAQQKEARAQQFISQFDGSGLKPNDRVTVAMEEGDANIDMTFAGYSEDGKIVLSDGKDYLPLSKEEFAAWRTNALNNTINERLDREDGEREMAELKQAETDKKLRFANGIVGLSEGQPDYSSKDTDAKVAADYLQEQYGEDHGKLLNLVNGSRDDIKTQLDNKKKAAAEYQNWLDTNADLDPEKAKKVEDELSLVNEQIADLDARFKNWNTIRNSVMTPDEVKAMTEERKAEVEKAGVDETAIVPSDDFHVLVLDDKELKKQYPTMDKASDYITSQRKDIYHTQEDVEHKLNDVNDLLEQYINGETELDPTQLMELNTTKAQLEALQTNLSVAAKGLKAQANKLSKLYKTEVSQQEMEELGMTPSEQRKVLVSDAIKKNDLGAIKEIYKDASVDVTDLTPQTLEEAVSESLSPHSLNPESLQYELGKSNFKFGIGKRYDSNKFNYLIAKKGTGMSVNEFAVRVYNDLPVNLQDMGYTDQDVRNALLDMFKSYDSVKEMRNVALMNRIAAAEDELSSEEEFYEAQKEREIIERQAEIEKYKSYIHEKELSLPSESELDHINGLEFDRMMEIEDRDREYKQFVKSILPELADYDDRSNEEGYGGGSSLGSDSSRRGVDEGNRQGEEISGREASSQSETGESTDSGRKGRQETGSMEPGEGSVVRGAHLPQEASFGERLKNAIAETEPNPSEAQKKAGNYKKGHLSFGGYDFTVETPKGTTRSGKDEQGKPWSVTMHDTYGYILGKIGVDGDHIDMFINDAADLDSFDGNVYVVDQVNPETGEFDEHKVMYGYPSEEAATEAYLANYSKDWKGLGKVTAVPKATFDKWLESSDRKTKPFADYAMVQKEQRAAYEEEMMQDGAHSEAFNKIVELGKEQKEYWDLMEQGEVDPDDVPEVDVAHEMDELLKTLSDEEFKEVSDVLENLDEEFEYWTANEHERREDLAERKNAAAYSEFLKQETKSIAPFADALRTAVNSGDKKAIAKAQKKLTDALLASNLGHGYLSGQLEYAKSAKKKDESYSERRAFIKPLTDAINAIESALDSALADVGLEGVHVDFKEYGYGWIYADKGSDWSDRLEPLDNDYRNVSQYSDVNPISVLPQITMNNVKKVAGIIKSRIEEGERYNSDENQDENIEEAKKAKDDLPFHRDVKEVKQSEMTEAQKVAYDAVSTMLKKAGIPVKVVSNEDMEKVAEAQDNLNLAMLLNQPEMRFKIKTPEEKQAAENAYNFAKDLRPNKWAQYAVVDMSNPNKMPEFYQKQELARKERTYLNRLMWGNYKVFNLDKSFEDNVAGLTGSFPSEFDPYKIDAQTSKKNELKKQIKETEEAYKLTGQERKEYQNQLMKEYMDEHRLASENNIPDDVWREFDYKAIEKYQDKLDSLFAKYKDLDRQLKAIVQPGVQYLKGKGVVYGYTDGKEIVLNQEHLNPNTPIHEYQHLWRTAAKEMNPELIAHGDELIKQTQLFRDLKEDENYKHLSDDEICDEAFARLTGEDGAAILEQMAKEAIKENPLDTAKELTIINRLKNWLKKFWYWSLDTFTKWKPEDIKKMTLEDIRNLVLRDLANGVDPRTVLNEKKAKKEDKTLAGVHNITEEKLRKALKLGGFANPSLAVIDTSKTGHNNFGEISFIAPSALVDKRTGKTGGTWITDAYTQRYPSVEREMSEKGRQKFNDWVDSLEYPAADKAEIKRQAEDALSNNNAPAWELMYLKEKGIDIKEYDSRIDYRWKEIIRDHPTAEDILNSMQTDPELNEKVTGLAKHIIVDPIRGKISLEVRRKIYKETGVKMSSLNPQVRKQTKEIFERDYKPTLLDKDGKPKAEDIKKVVEDIVKEHNDTKKYDFYLSKVKASNYVNKNGLYDDYIRWQENKLDEFGTKNRIFRGYKNDGTRKYVPETLENVSKAMREDAGGETNGSEYTSFGSFIAKLASRVDSTDEMRANKDKLSSNEDKEVFYDKWSDVYYELAKFLYNDVFYGEQRLHDIVSHADPKKYAKKEYGITLSSSFMKKLDSLKNAVQNELKSAYFETKFNRPVHLNEFVAAVVPNNLGEDVRKGLEESGLILYDYDPEKEGDRSRAFNEAVNSDENIRFMFAGEKGAAEADKAEEKTYRMDNLKVAEKMERGKKDAKAIKLATGWERGADGKWRYEMPDAKIKDMKDIGGGNIVKRFDDDMLWNDGKLADVIDAPGLFEAYPQLKDVRIDTDAIMNDMPSNGEYNPKTNTITIHADELKYMNSILNHEIQHAIQSIEGFATGGNEDSVRSRIEDRMQNIEDAANVAAGTLDEYRNISTRLVRLELARKWKKNPNSFLKSSAMFSAPGYGPFTPKKEAIEIGQQLADTWIDDAKRFVDSRSERLLAGEDKMDEAKVLAKWKNEWHNKYVDWKDFKEEFDQLDKAIKDLSDYQLYHALAGEVESRNVQNRLGMTDEERRNSLAEETEDVNRDEQIVMNVGDTSYSIVKDPETIKKLDKEDTVKVYRAMQVGEDGKLYPPMAAKVKGKFVEPIELGKWEQADERPELADDKGMFTLNKGNGKSLKAAYNPYLHTSRTPLNDQFSEAQNRPNIVTVEVEVPKSELTSGYKADKAKDAVGEVEWKAGIIQGQLTGKRKVVLSRWDKPVRIVPDSEVADVIVNDMFKGKNITMPSNVVTPSLRKELEKRGVPFVETDNRGRIVGGENDGVHYSKVYGKNHREKGYRSILKFSLGDNGTDVADGNGDSINKNPNKNVITRRIGSREQAQRRVNETLGAAASDLQRSLGATAKEQRPTWNRRSALGYVRRRAEELSSLLTEKDLKEIQGGYIGHGQENYVYQAKYDDKKVVKFNDFSLTDSLFRINEFIDRVNAHNQFQPKDKYTPIGFAYDEKGDFCIVMEQPYLKGTQPTREEITQYLTDHGFKLDMIQISADEVDLGWTNGEFDLWDAEPRNVIKDENGDLHFFDTMIQHTYIPNHKNPLRLSMPSIRTFESQEMKNSADKVKNVANVLGGAEAVTYTSSADVPEEYRVAIELGAKGWYDPTTHTVHVYLPNCADANEAQRTVFHEKIGHEGMEVLLGGEDEVRKFANFVYNSVAASTRGKILEIANEYDPDWKKHDRMNVGTQEYIARLAEEGPKTAEDFSLWTKIKHYLIKVLKKLGIRVPGLLNDKDLRYYLMKAGKALHVWDEMPQEKQEAMMKQASNAEIKDALSDGAGKGKPRQKKGESMIQYMKRVQEWRKWKNAREDENDPEPPMFYDIDKDEAGKKEWAQLNKDWRERHHLAGEEPTGLPIRMEGEEDGAYMTRIHEYEKWKDAMKDQEDPMPDMFAFEKKKQEEVKRKYEDWLARHELLEQQQADLDLYEGKIYPAETNPKADDLEQQVMQDLAEVTSTDVSKEGAAKTVKHAVIHRRKNMEEASADDAIYINDVKNRIEKMADSGAFDKLLSDYQGKPNRAEKLAEAIPYIIEAPRRLRDLAHDLNATGAFDKGHIHIQPADVEAIQPYVADLIAETGKKHTELRDGKEVEVYDDPQAVSDVASKMAQVINDNHQGEEGFVPIDGTDILSEHVLPLVKQQIVPEGIDYKNLSPEMQAAIDSIRDWYNYTYDWLKDNRTLKEDTGYNVDYVNHIWDKEKSDKQAYAMYVENRQRTKSPNEKKRTISTLMEGISVGLVPKTTDITKMMAYYSRSNIEAWVNKTMLQELSGLNVIERNEDGEVVSTDPLLSSSAPFNLEQYKYFEIPGVGPVWVYNVSPKQVKVKNPITGKEKVLYSEASAGDRFGVVFETYQSSPFWKAFDTLASSAKKLELGFSGFHAGALTEVYMVQNMVEFGPKKAMANFMKYIFVDTAKNHELPCFANPQDFQEAASHLVKFGATNDYSAADVQNMFDNMRDAMMKVQEKLKDGNGISGTVAVATMPLKVVTQMLSLINKGMDRALWDFLHDGLKLATYRMRADKTKERAKKKGWSAEELSRALDEDGQFVNDMFGGQHWDVLGASHRTLRYAGRVLLSPDWNASTTRHFLALTGFGSIWNEATFENFKQYYQRLWNKELIPEDEGRRGRQISALLCYGIGFMVFYEAFANGINAAFRALDEEKEREKAEEIRKTNPSYKSMYELAYGDDGMKWYDYLMRGNSLGQQSKIFMGRYEDGTEMYIRHGKQFREVPEYLFNHKGELEFPGPMVQRMIGKANPMVRMTLDDINYLSDFQASHADQEIQRKYGKTIGLLYKDALYWAPFLIPSQENKEFKAVDFFFPSSKGFSPWKAQSYFKDFILSGDMEGVVMTYQSCQRNGIDAEAQIKAAIGSVKALESAEMNDGVTSLQVACQRFDAAKSITEKKKMRQKMKKFLSQSDYKAFTQKEALDMVQGYLNGDEDLKEMEKAESKYLMKAKAEDVTEDWRIQNVCNGTVEAYQEYQRLKDVDKAKANAFKNSKTNKRLLAARKAISAAKKKMNKAKKQMDGTNDAAKLVEIRNTRKELLNTLNGME